MRSFALSLPLFPPSFNLAQKHKTSSNSQLSHFPHFFAISINTSIIFTHPSPHQKQYRLRIISERNSITMVAARCATPGCTKWKVTGKNHCSDRT